MVRLQTPTPFFPTRGLIYTHAAGSSVGRAIGFPKGSLRVRPLARSRADSAWLPSTDGARVRVPPRCIPSLFTPWDGGGTGRHTLRLPVGLSFPTPCLPFQRAEAGRLSGRCAVRHAGSSPARPPFPGLARGLLPSYGSFTGMVVQRQDKPMPSHVPCPRPTLGGPKFEGSRSMRVRIPPISPHAFWER